jgi:CBS domain-containing protein
MSIQSQKEFLQSHHPFDKLTNYELDLCVKNINIGYYPKETTIISSTEIPEYFFIIIKGELNEYKEEELVAVYHEYDSFDADSLMYGKTQSSFKVVEDIICYELNKKIFLQLLEQNEKFKNFYLSNMSERLQKLKTKEYANDMSGFMVARVSELYLHKPCVVDANETIANAIADSIELKTSTIIVQKQDQLGIVTDSVLKKDVLLKSRDLEQPIDSIAIYPFLCVDHEDFLFQVLLTLTERNIKRVGVTKEGKIIGTLNQVDVLSYFANHVHLIANQIEKATTIEDLKRASGDIVKTVKSLFVKSVKTTYIAKMVAQLNAKVYRKLFEFVVPPELQEQCSLLVMGSEGRNEQILKTDQDNALIIKDGIDIEQFRPLMEKFTASLIEFGFPPCDGKIMVNNPYWCKSFSDFDKQLDIWLAGSDKDDYMNLAIFFDAKTVAGESTMLDQLKQKLFDKIDNKDVYMAYFAKNSLLFDTPIGMFSNLIAKNDEIDLKKGAIFALVQGVRSLALEHKLFEQSTTARIKNLSNQGVIEKEKAKELIEAFSLLLRLKLQGQMAELNSGKQIDNNINLTTLSKIQRDMLKDSFQIVNEFKKFITHHFKLNNLM